MYLIEISLLSNNIRVYGIKNIKQHCDCIVHRATLPDIRHQTSDNRENDIIYRSLMVSLMVSLIVISLLSNNRRVYGIKNIKQHYDCIVHRATLSRRQTSHRQTADISI